MATEGQKVGKVCHVITVKVSLSSIQELNHCKGTKKTHKYRMYGAEEAGSLVASVSNG